MKQITHRLLFAFIFVITSFSIALAQDSAQVSKEAAYTKTITKRADDIVVKLGISDSVKYKQVRSIIVDQYRDLNNIYNDRDARIKEAKASGNEKAKIDSSIKLVESDVAGRIDVMHKKYISKLASQLSNTQVDQVKDGMTYGVVNVTYKGYQDMIPTLTEPQKAQILAWLIEAREKAMDGESSEKKHAVFGKYKGRINNYLSAQGYDSQKERAAWEERIKAAKAKP